MSIQNIKLTIQYDGTCYSGWQIQKNQKTIQGELKRIIEDITLSDKVNIIVSFAPVMTLLFEFLVFGTVISWLEILGGVIMLSAIIWIFLPGLNTNAKPTEN